MSVKFRQVGGSTVVAIPPAILRQAGLKTDSKVEITAESDAVVIRPVARRRYTLSELMKQCDLKAPIKRSKEEQEFMDAPRSGKEEL